MSEPFEEPETLGAWDRSWKGQKEQLRLERSEFRGRPVYMLRVYWQNDAAEWRWAGAKASSTGRHWQALSLKARELRELGQALIAEADEREHISMGPATEPRGGQARQPNIHEQHWLDRFEDEHTQASAAVTDPSRRV